MRNLLPVLILLLATAAAHAAPPPVYLWLEAEWFGGVDGSFVYWTGTAKPTGTWGVAGPAGGLCPLASVKEMTGSHDLAAEKGEEETAEVRVYVQPGGVQAVYFAMKAGD